MPGRISKPAASAKRTSARSVTKVNNDQSKTKKKTVAKSEKVDKTEPETTLALRKRKVQHEESPAALTKATKRPRAGEVNIDDDKREALSLSLDLVQASAAPSKGKGRGRPPGKAQASAVSLNKPPSEVLQLFVFGDGDMGVLGLGPKDKEAPRPKPNPFLDPSKPAGFEVVQVDCGGLHVIALTKCNKILTWGVNDKSALGRDTNWGGEKLRDMDADPSSEDEEDDLNPLESTPTPIPASSFKPGTKFTQVAAADNLSLALTDTGEVYGWGTFLNDEGKECFGYDAKGNKIAIQKKPVLIPSLKNITQIVCASNHCLALSSKGELFAWGIPAENRLGRRVVERRKETAFTPHLVEIKSVKAIFSGNRHSFAIDTRDNVWAWGLNSFGETGARPDQAGSENFYLDRPRKIPALCGKKVKFIAAGAHHSAAITEDNKCYLWGKMDAGQLGIDFSQAQLDDGDLILRGELRNDPRICLQPTPVATVLSGAPTSTSTEVPAEELEEEPLKAVVSVACGTEHTVFINAEGRGFASGFGFQGQLGFPADDDVLVARPIKAKSVRETKLAWAGAGSNFSIVAAVYEGKGGE